MPFRFEGLTICHRAREFSKLVHRLTAKFPRREEYALASQMNRAAHAVVLNIAEGSAKKSGKHFDLFLEYSLGSIFETVSGGFQAMDLDHIGLAEKDALHSEAELQAKAINAFRRSLPKD